MDIPMEIVNASGPPAQAASEPISVGKTLDLTTGNTDEITRMLRDAPWLLTDEQLARVSLSRLSKTVGIVSSPTTFDVYLRWLEIQRTEPKNNFNADWTGVIAQWTQSFRARGFSLDELIKMVLDWADLHGISKKYLKELEDSEATGVKPRQPPTAAMLERGWARILEGAVGSKGWFNANAAGTSSRLPDACSKGRQAPTVLGDLSRSSTVVPVILSKQQSPAADSCRNFTAETKQRSSAGNFGDHYRPSRKPVMQQVSLTPGGDTHMPSLTNESTKTLPTVAACPREPSAAGARAPVSAVGSCRKNLASSRKQTPANQANSACLPRTGPWIHDKYFTEAACFDKPVPSSVKRSIEVSSIYICNRCKEHGHHVVDCPTNMDPSYDHAPDSSYVCNFCNEAGVHFNLFCPKNRTSSSVYLQRLREGTVDKAGASTHRKLEPSPSNVHKILGYPRDLESYYWEPSRIPGARDLKRPREGDDPKRKPPSLRNDGRLCYLPSFEDESNDSNKSQGPTSHGAREHGDLRVDNLESKGEIGVRSSALVTQQRKWGEFKNTDRINENLTISGTSEILQKLFRESRSQIVNARKPRLTALDMWDISDANEDRKKQELTHQNATSYKELTGRDSPNSLSQTMVDQAEMPMVVRWQEARSVEAPAVEYESREIGLSGPSLEEEWELQDRWSQSEIHDSLQRQNPASGILRNILAEKHGENDDMFENLFQSLANGN